MGADVHVRHHRQAQGSHSKPSRACADLAGDGARQGLRAKTPRCSSCRCATRIRSTSHSRSPTWAPRASSTTTGSFDPEALLATMAAQRVTFTSLVPTHYIMTLGLPDKTKATYDVGRVRKLMISSAPARKDTKLAILDHFRNSELYELYGSTEAGWVTLLRPDEQIDHLGSVGREWTGSGASKDARCARPRGSGRRGRGALFPARRTASTATSMIPARPQNHSVEGYCSVGDMGRRDEHGFIHLVDRKSNMIISGGENVPERGRESARPLSRRQGRRRRRRAPRKMGRGSRRRHRNARRRAGQASPAVLERRPKRSPATRGRAP